MTTRTGTAHRPARDRLWARPYRGVAAAVLGLMTCIAFESYAIVTALPVVAADLRADDWYSLAFAATVATGLVGMVLGGSWADRSGPRTPLVVGGTLFLLGLALCTAAPDMGTFIAGRLLQGIGGGIDSVIAYVLIAQLVPEHLRPRMFGLLTAAWLLPAILGPLVTGILVDVIHWRAVFGIVLGGSAVALAVLLRLARRTPAVRTAGRVLGRRGSWAIVACLGVIGLHLAAHVPLPWMLMATLVALAIAGLATDRIMPPGTLTARPGPPQLVAAKGLLGATVAATDIYLAHYLQRELGYSPTSAGGLVAIAALGWFTGSWLQGRAATTTGSHRRLVLAAALVVGGPLAVLALVTGVVPVPVAIAGCVIMGVGMGMAYPRITTAALAQTDQTRHGHISSALQAVEQLGVAMLTAITGAVLILPTTDGYAAVYALVTAVGVGALVVLARRPVVAGGPA